MVERVSKYILQHHLMEMDKKYLLALSGGADSVCLLLILKQLGYSVEAVHCNFHLRGEESDRDEQFCVSFCEKQQVLLHLIHFDTREYAALHHLSIEMAARELRYHYFAALCRDLQSDGVCVAHHQDDSVETVLMNLIRGTGVHGLTGIAPLSILESDLKVIRPLLCMTRDEIEQFLQDIGQDYVTDSTNLQADMAVRNKIRMEVIPLLQQINPSVKECIALSAHHIQEAAKVFDAAMKTHVAKVMTDNRISIKMLKTLPSPEYTLYTILKDFGFSSLQVEQISQRLDAEAGTVFSSATHELLVDREELIIEPLFVTAKPMRIPEPGTYLYQCASNGTRHDEDSSLRFRFSLTKMNMGDIPHDKHTACLDAATVSFPLTIRPVQQGDRFQPFGMKGSKLISDYLTDRKCSLFDKRRQLVVTDSTNRIVWLVNQRPNDFCRVTELTKEVLLITIS
ncbi:MAG: tRNA lysidine(34) synthetase TilS [Prevotella sp.]|nr:tRNA lysidine(34) synthetase TilS [Prevotella sp.]